VATITADELKQRLAKSGFVYDPSPTTTLRDQSGQPISADHYGKEPKFLFRHLLSGEHFTADDIIPYVQIEQQALYGKPRDELVQAIENIANQSAATPFGPNTINVSEAQEAQILNQTIEMQRAYDASRNRGGLFGGFLGDLLGGVNEVITGVTDPIANALGVHPDVVKVAAAALGMYYAPGVGAADAAGAAVSDAAAAEMIAAYGADALTAAGQMEAAAALASAAPAAAAPAATAFPVATSPLATMGAATPLTAAELAAADASAGLLGSSNALAPGAATAIGANALSAADLAAADASAGLLGSSNALATGAGAGTLAGYGGAGDVLNTATGGVLTGADAATGLGAAGAGAGAGAGAAGTISGYGGAGDVLDPVTGSVISAADAAAITNAGFNLSDFAKLAKDYGVPLSLLASAFMGSRAATSAAETQAQSAREARQLARDIFNEQKALQEPYRAAGITAQNQLLNLLGLSGNTAAAEYGKFARPFGMSDFQADPGYAFRLSEGMKALEASRAAKGGLLSGATGKALQRYGQEMGSQEYGSAFNRFQTERANRLNPLAGLMASGQAAAAGQAANAGNYATTAGNLTTDIGAAQAAGGIGSANAITNALNQFARYSAGQNLANNIRSSVYV
jgi:hypothetical protein